MSTKQNSLLFFLFLILLVIMPLAIGDSLLLTSFESEQDVEMWVTTKNVSMCLSQEYSTHSNSSVKVVFPHYMDGVEEYPAIRWYSRDGMPGAWHEYSRLAFDYYNPSEEKFSVDLNITDSASRRVQIFSLAFNPGKGKIEIPFKDKNINTATISSIEFYMWMPIKERIAFIDNFRLEAGPLAPRDCKATREGKTSYTRVSWTKPNESYPDEKAVAYRVYRGDSFDGSDLMPLADVTQTFWVDESTEFDCRYFYRTTAIDGFGREGVPSEIFSVNVVGILNSFETNDEFKGWKFTANVLQLERSTDYASDGLYSLQISINTSNQGAWPTFEWPWWEGLATDWSGFDVLAFDYYNPRSQDIPVDFKITSQNGSYQSGGATNLTSGKGTAQLNILGRGLDLSNITQLQLFFWNQGVGNSCTFYIDNIRLIDTVPPESPSNFRAERINGKPEVNISWAPAGGASDGDLAMRYRVYHSENEEFEAKELFAEVDANTFELAAGDVPAAEVHYAVVAVDKMGNESPLQKARVEATGIIKGSVTGDGLTTTTIYIPELEETFSTDINGEFSIAYLIPGTYSAVIGNEGFRLITLDNLAVIAGSEFGLGDISLSRDTIPPNAPRNLEANSSVYFGIVVLSWDEPEISDGEDELDTEVYNIYKIIERDVKITSGNMVGTTHNRTWVDNVGVQLMGKTVYYAIEAVDGARNVSKVTSNIASAIAEVPPFPSATAPLGRELIKDEIVKFEWEYSGAESSSEFVIEVSDDNKFSKAKTKSYTLDSMKRTYTLEEALPQGTWYWRVRAGFETEINSTLYAVNSNWSEVCEFVISPLFDNPHLAPYLNVYPKIMEGEPVRINYLLTDYAKVTLRIFNLAGKQVASIVVEEVQMPDEHSYNWSGIGSNGKELYNGLYFIQLITEPLSVSENKIILQRKLVINR